MVSKKETTVLEHSRVRLSVVVPQAEVSERYASLVKEYAKEAIIKGFRKGKVPVSVLESKYGKEMRSEAFGKIIEKALEECYAEIEDKPLPYSYPELEGEPDFSLDKDFEFTVVYDIFPKFQLPSYEGIEVEYPDVKVEKADEDRELERIRERNALVVDKKEGATAAKDDVVTIDYCELDDRGEVIESSKREGFVFTVGTGYNYYGIDDEVIGMKVGDEKVLAKEFPADFQYQELAGRKVSLKVKLSKLKEKKLPELDDEFAQDVSEEYKTLADLRASIRDNMEHALEQKLREIQLGEIIGKLVDVAKIDLPVSMVEAELSGRLENLMRRIGASDVGQLDRFLAMSGKSREQIAEDWRPDAERALKARVVIESLLEKEGFVISQEEIEEEFKKLAVSMKSDLEKVKEQYGDEGTKARIVEDIKERKLYDAMLKAAKLKKGKKKKFVDLFEKAE